VFFGLWKILSGMPSPRRRIQFRTSSASPLGSVTIAGLAVRQRAALAKPRVFGQYALVYLLSGEGTYADANGWEQRLTPGDLILVFPELRHLYNPLPGTEWVTSFLCFRGPLFDLCRERGLLDSRRPVLHFEPVDEWHRRLENALGADRQIGGQPPLVEAARLLELLAAFATEDGGASLRREDRRWAERARGLIEAELGRALDWAAVARQFGLSAEGFRKKFARLTGHSPAQYRMGRLIDRACDLMCEGHLTDAQIAERLGFCDPFYFSRRFKEITGKSPRAFRASLALKGE